MFDGLKRQAMRDCWIEEPPVQKRGDQVDQVDRDDWLVSYSNDI